MKLVCISGGTGTEAILARWNVPFDRRFEATDNLNDQLDDAGCVICIGKAGVQAGLFVLHTFKKNKTSPPVLAAYQPSTDAAKTDWSRFDGVLYKDAAQRQDALKAGADPFRLFPESDVMQAAETAVRRKRMTVPQKGVVISGSYGLGNLGDEAMLTAILAALHRVAPDRRVIVLSHHPEETRLTHCVDAIHTFALHRLIRQLPRTGLLISGGGTLVTNLTSSRSMRYYLTVIRLAHCFGAHVLLYSCGIGPIRGKRDRKVATAVLNACADTIAVRDSSSEKELTALGVKRPKICRMRDVAFSLCPEGLRKAKEWSGNPDGLNIPGKYAVYAIRPWTNDAAFLPVLAAAVERLWRERGLRPVFLPMESPKDLSVAETLAKQLQIPCTVLPPVASFADAFAVIQKAELVISMRLHALIAAELAHVPFVGIAYDVKITAFLTDVGSDACVGYHVAEPDMLYDAAERAMHQNRPAHGNDESCVGDEILRAAFREKNVADDD